jgi:hypothetical protein
MHSRVPYLLHSCFTHALLAGVFESPIIRGLQLTRSLNTHTGCRSGNLDGVGYVRISQVTLTQSLFLLTFPALFRNFRHLFRIVDFYFGVKLIKLKSTQMEDPRLL